MKDKIQLLFIPFLLALIGLTTVYTLLHWLLFIYLKVISLKEMIVCFGIPAALSALAIFFYLRPKVRILDFKNKRADWPWIYLFLLWIILCIPVITAQEYIATASGKLTELTTIGEIGKRDETRYYTVKQFYIDKEHIGVFSDFDVSGRYSEDFNMHLYVALPILSSISDTSGPECPAWFGVEYYKTISNRLEPEEKEREYRKFTLESQADFEKKDVSKFIYLDRIENSDDRDGFISAIKENRRFAPNTTVLTPVNEPFEARNGSKLEWIFGTAGIGSLVWLFMIMIPATSAYQVNRIRSGQPDRKRRRERREVISFFRINPGYPVTQVLIYINAGIFLLMAVMGLGFISFKGPDLVQWGANFGPYTRNGEWWRLLTSTFLHGGLMHVLMNMYSLFFVGIFLEPLLGRVKYLSIYLLTGVLASCTSLWWHEATVIGASGAIFGLYGLFLAFLLLKIYPAEFSRAFLTSTLVFMGYSLLMGLAGGIDNAAHIGGLLSGFVTGLILYPGIKQKITSEEATVDQPEEASQTA